MFCFVFGESLHIHVLLYRTFLHAPDTYNISVSLFTLSFILWKESSLGVPTGSVSPHTLYAYFIFIRTLGKVWEEESRVRVVRGSQHLWDGEKEDNYYKLKSFHLLFSLWGAAAVAHLPSFQKSALIASAHVNLPILFPPLVRGHLFHHFFLFVEIICWFRLPRNQFLLF